MGTTLRNTFGCLPEDNSTYTRSLDGIFLLVRLRRNTWWNYLSKWTYDPESSLLLNIALIPSFIVRLSETDTNLPQDAQGVWRITSLSAKLRNIIYIWIKASIIMFTSPSQMN
ncbi:uncharacterized protein LOC129760653 [Uranotaenia lowii]|uniref:uncharacterized protein LOC129760653 n=1 Tax=Uranotaenia lowii TaxID=190385 RepID=UPI002478BBD1|nr:uncharacterized protein LOC129760653 [Uranotaenia lowii]